MSSVPNKFLLPLSRFATALLVAMFPEASRIREIFVREGPWCGGFEVPGTVVTNQLKQTGRFNYQTPVAHTALAEAALIFLLI